MKTAVSFIPYPVDSCFYHHQSKALDMAISKEGLELRKGVVPGSRSHQVTSSSNIRPESIRVSTGEEKVIP